MTFWLLRPFTSSLELNTAAPYIKVSICKFIIVTKNKHYQMLNMRYTTRATNGARTTFLRGGPALSSAFCRIVRFVCIVWPIIWPIVCLFVRFHRPLYYLPVFALRLLNTLFANILRCYTLYLQSSVNTRCS